MQESRHNDRLQIIAAVGVIVGLLFVAFEIRESNRIAKGESIRSIQDAFLSIYQEQYTSDIHDLFVKSIEDPENLTPAEILKLDSYLATIIEVYQRWWRMNDLGLSDFDGLDDLSRQVDYYFSSQFGRAWFDQNRSWMRPATEETIDQKLSELPIRTVPPRVEELQSQF